MSDFDQFFKDGLNEEQEFSNRERNWGHLSKRLDAYSLGGSAGPKVIQTVYWKAAAVIFLAVAAGLFWKMNTVQQELTALRQELKSISTVHAAPVVSAPAPTSATVLPNTAGPSHSDETATVPTLSNNNTITNRSGLRTSNSNNKLPIEFKHTPQVSNTPSAAVSTQKFNQVPSSGPTDQRPDPAVEKSAATEPANHPDVPEGVNPSAPTAEKITAAGTLSDKLNTQLAALESGIEAPHSKVAPPHTPLPNATVSVPPPAMIIRPVRDVSRFQAGVHYIVGIPTPTQKSISPMLGYGLQAAYTPLRNLSVFASADFTHFDIKSAKYRPELPFTEPQNDLMHPQHDLVSIEGTQRQQNISIGVQYSIPLKTWIRPAVRAAHTWTHFSSCLISNRFEEMHGFPGGPPPMHDDEYRIEHTKPANFGNIWRMGAGLEHETPRWVFSVWCDYAKNMNAVSAGFSNIFLQAGASYKFR
jgi:hypothetical protein